LLGGSQGDRALLFASISSLLIDMNALRQRVTFTAAALYVLLAWTTGHPVQAEERVVKIVVLGDSLTAGNGLVVFDAFPAKLEHALRSEGQTAVVANAGVSGDTAAMGLARFDQSIPADTDAVILELGANDMLRGFEPNVTRAALAAILRKLEARKVVVLFCGVRTQPSLGDEYKRAFAAMFSSLATEYNALFYPAFDDAFVDQPQLKLSDGLHPTAPAIEAVVADILPRVEALIDRARHEQREPNG
jgi:acyl-CoA thioesterase-1